MTVYLEQEERFEHVDDTSIIDWLIVEMPESMRTGNLELSRDLRAVGLKCCCDRAISDTLIRITRCEDFELEE